MAFGGAVFSANTLVSQVTLTWLNASAGVISTSTAGPVTPASGSAFQYVHSGAAVPAGAVAVALTVQCTATAGTQTVYWDRMWITNQSVWSGQLLPLDAEFNEVSTVQWSGTLNCTAAVGPVGTYYPACGSALQLTAAAAGDMRAVPVAAPVTVTPGTELMATGYAAQTTGATRTVVIEIMWLASDGTTLIGTTTSPAFTVPSASWTHVTAIGTCPAGAARAQPRLRPQAGGAAEVWDADHLGLLDTVAGAWVDEGNLIGYNGQSIEMDT